MTRNAPYKRCVMILADGTRPDMFASLLSAGRLPAIERYVTRPGGLYQGVTTFPSTTGPAYMPFLTGHSAAQCNVPGIRWMDKSAYRPGTQRGVRSYVGIESALINRDMTPGVDTLFSLLPNAYNLFNAVNRGVSLRTNPTMIKRLWHCYYAHLTDRWSYLDQASTRALCDTVQKEFGFCFVVYFGVDEYGHLSGPTSAQTTSAYETLDRGVAETAQILEKQGKLDDTLWWIVSDHGLSDTHTHFCLNAFLDARGWRTMFYPKIYRKTATAANMMSGNGMSHLYFRHESGWAEPVTAEYFAQRDPDLLNDLLAQPAIDLLAVRAEGGRIVVQTDEGHAVLSGDTAMMHYQVVSGDPLHLGGSRPVSREHSLSATLHARYPDAAFQLVDLFNCRRTGDVVVSATPGYDLRVAYEHPEHRGSHGSLHAAHMRVPILSNLTLPDQAMRTTDVFYHTLEALGRPVPQMASSNRDVA